MCSTRATAGTVASVVYGMRIMGVLAVLLMAAALGGCGQRQSPGGAGGQAAEELPTGRKFLSTTVTDAAGPRALASKKPISLEFREGEVRVNAGCNVLFGPAVLRDGKLVVESLGSTQMGCPPELMRQDQWLSDFLAGDPQLELEGQTLRLSSGATSIELLDREVADPDRPLRGTRWTVNTIVDGNAAQSTPRDAEAFLTFSDDGTVSGNSGCNQFSGRYTVDGSTLRIDNLNATLMACDGGGGKLEQAVLGVLEGGALEFRIEADKLTLTGADTGLRLQAS